MSNLKTIVSIVFLIVILTTILNLFVTETTRVSCGYSIGIIEIITDTITRAILTVFGINVDVSNSATINCEGLPADFGITITNLIFLPLILIISIFAIMVVRGSS